MSRKKARVNKLYTAALRPAVTYGSMANGLSDAALKRLRAAMLRSKPVYSQIMSTRRVLATQGDPTWKEAVAPARAWASLAWNAQTNPRGAELGLPNLLEMIQWYHQIQPEQQKSWQTSTGPTDRQTTPCASACRMDMALTFRVERPQWCRHSPWQVFPEGDRLDAGTGGSTTA